MDGKYFYLDLRDANWVTHYPASADLYIRWNLNKKKFEYYNSVQTDWSAFSPESSQSIWYMFNIENPNEEAFQPTPPRNFICTNASHVGQHPHFTWSAPSDPSGVTFSYNIYRSLGAGYSKINGAPITNTSYTDTEIEIVKNGSNPAVYYAAAMGSQSPESEPSNKASIQTNIAEKRILPGGSVSEKSEDNKQRHSLQLSNYPNPFNPVTTITYFLPDEGPVRLSVYNIRGQWIAQLVNKFEPAGGHSAYFDGSDLSGGVYFVRLQFENRSKMKKIILLK